MVLSLVDGEDIAAEVLGLYPKFEQLAAAFLLEVLKVQKSGQLDSIFKEGRVFFSNSKSYFKQEGDRYIVVEDIGNGERPVLQDFHQILAMVLADHVFVVVSASSRKSC